MAGKALALARLHCFERQSFVPQRALLAEVLRRGTGRVTLEAIHDAHKASDAIVREYRGRILATTPEVLAEEQAMLDYAHGTKGLCEALNDELLLHLLTVR